MLSEGLVHGYLNPIRDSRWRVRLLGLCECETTYLGTRMRPKTTQATLSREKEESEGRTHLRRQSLLECGAFAWLRWSL